MDRQQPIVRPLQATQSALLERVVYVLRGVAFWTAIALTLVYLPFFVTGTSPVPLRELVGIVGLHTIALVVGHEYLQE